MSRDVITGKIENTQSISRYHFNFNNPLRYVDLNGWVSNEQFRLDEFNEHLKNPNHAITCSKIYNQIKDAKSAEQTEIKIEAVFWKIFKTTISISDLRDKSVLQATLEYGLKYEEWERNMSKTDLKEELKGKISKVKILFGLQLAHWSGGMEDPKARITAGMSRRVLDMKNNFIGARMEELAPGENAKIEDVRKAYQQAVKEWEESMKQITEGKITGYGIYEENYKKDKSNEKK